MKKHTKLYMDFFGYAIGDFIPSELTGRVCVDINHIDARGMGGTKKIENIYNLIGMAREEHDFFGDKKIYKEWMELIHLSFIDTRQPWIEICPDCEILKQYLNR